MLEALGLPLVPGDQEVPGADELLPVPDYKDPGVLKPPGNKVQDNQEVKFSLIKTSYYISSRRK